MLLLLLLLLFLLCLVVEVALVVAAAAVAVAIAVLVVSGDWLVHTPDFACCLSAACVCLFFVGLLLLLGSLR